MTPGIPVDGERPAVEWVTSLPEPWHVTPSERLILMCLACDAYEWGSAPGYDAVADWTGMHRSSCAEILTRLCEATEYRPALLERVSVRGRRRTLFRLLAKQEEPSGHAGRLEESEEVQPSANRPATQDGSGLSTVGEPSGHAGRLDRSATTATVGEPSGDTGRLEAPTVGEPSANRPATPDAPLALNPKDKPQSQNLGADDDDLLSGIISTTNGHKTKAPRRKTLKTTAPDDFVITDQLKAWAREKSLTVDLNEATEEFLNHHRAKGSEFVDWTSAWRTWMSRTRQYGGPSIAGRSGVGIVAQGHSDHWNSGGGFFNQGRPA